MDTDHRGAASPQAGARQDSLGAAVAPRRAYGAWLAATMWFALAGCAPDREQASDSAGEQPTEPHTRADAGAAASLPGPGASSGPAPLTPIDAGLAAASPLRDGAVPPGRASPASGADAAALSPDRDAAAIGDDLSQELYDPANLPRFDLELPAESIAALEQVTGADDPRQNTYVRATLKYRGETVTEIGLRFKGEGSFQKLDRKPAFKLKFDEFVKGQSFRGLRRMVLNNAFEDPSFVAERLAYDVYRAAGLPAPRCNNALLYINGSFYGVYVNVEAEDKTFLRRWFADDGGNLYEEGQMDFIPGAEASFDLETNETANDRSDLRGLIAAIQGATPATFLSELEAHLDTRQFLKFTAAEAAVNQWDMYSYTVFYMNNLRLYHDPARKKFSFLPWGMDLSMKPFRDSGKPYIELFELARQGTLENGRVSAGLLFQRCLESSSCRTDYAAAVRELIGTYEALGLEQRAMRYYAQVRPHVLADPRKRVCCSGQALTNQQFETGFQSVLTTVRGRAGALREDLESL